MRNILFLLKVPLLHQTKENYQRLIALMFKGFLPTSVIIFRAYYTVGTIGRKCHYMLGTKRPKHRLVFRPHVPASPFSRPHVSDLTSPHPQTHFPKSPISRPHTFPISRPHTFPISRPHTFPISRPHASPSHF